MYRVALTFLPAVIFEIIVDFFTIRKKSYRWKYEQPTIQVQDVNAIQ